MQAAKQNKKGTEIRPQADSNICEGKRILEIKVLGKNLKCSKCSRTLLLENETENGTQLYNVGKM